MMWIPVTAAGIINGIGHYWGYRNFASADASTNIVPWGILIGGEELHNNHHAYGTSAKLSSQWYEFDIGWMYIRILVGAEARHRAQGRAAGEARPCQARARPRHAAGRDHASLSRRHGYARSLKAACAAELEHLKSRAGAIDLPSTGRMKRWLLADPETLSEADRAKLSAATTKSKALATIYAMRQELSTVWERSTESSEQLLARLQDWCRRAEASGIAPLVAFSHQLRRYA